MGQGRHMGRGGDDHLARAGNSLGQGVGVGAADLVVLAGHDQDRALDGAQLGQAVVRQGAPHCHDLAIEDRPPRRRWRQKLVGPPLRRDARIVRTWPRTATHVCQAGDIEIGSDHHHPPDAVRMMDGEVQADNAAVAPAHQVGLGDMQPVHQGDHILGHLVVGQRTWPVGRAAMGAAVRRDHQVMGRQRRDLVVHGLDEGRATVQDQHRRARAIGLVVEVHAVDGRMLAAVSARPYTLPEHEGRNAIVGLAQGHRPRRAHHDQDREPQHHRSDPHRPAPRC